MPPTIFTIGSSTRTWAEFLAVLAAYGIQALADVRRFPVSRRYPHFTREAMAAALPPARIGYRWLGQNLGGYRTGRYEAHMRTNVYQAGLAELEAMAREAPTAFLCAERLPSACHRRFIAGTLEGRGWEIVHILEVGRIWSPSASELTFPGLSSQETVG